MAESSRFTFAISFRSPVLSVTQRDAEYWRIEIADLLHTHLYVEEVVAEHLRDYTDQYRFALTEIITCSDEVDAAFTAGDPAEAIIRLRSCAEMARGLIDVEG